MRFNPIIQNLLNNLKNKETQSKNFLIPIPSKTSNISKINKEKILERYSFLQKLNIKDTLVQNIKEIHNLQKIFVITFIALLLSSINMTFCMEHGKEALDVANALAENNVPEAERLLQILQNRNLTETQMRDLNNIINSSLEVRVGPGAEYQVQNLELQNVGNPPTEPFNYRGLFVTLVVVGASILTIYLIIRYWDEIRDFLFGSARNIAPQTLPALRIILFGRIRVIRDATTLQRLTDYVNNLPEE